MNAGGLAEGIAESELFGHVKGAFTDARVDRIGCFEMADEGTLFLDEIANMPIRLQAKLLRVLQTGELQRVGSSRLRYVNVRVLSATNADLTAEIAAGRFREDLLYRLNTVVIHLPPLRERRDDVDGAGEALPRASTPRATASRSPASRPTRWRRCRRTAGPATSASWRTAIERAVLMADPAATADRGAAPRPAAAARGGDATQPDELSLEEAERVFIEKVLARHNGDVRLAAEQLGMSRSALYRRLQQYGVRELAVPAQRALEPRAGGARA